MWLLTCLALVGLALSPAAAQDFPTDPNHLTSVAQEELLDGTSLGTAPSGPPRLLMALALDLIKDFEMWVPHAYNDASIYCTIGYGHLIARKPCSYSTVELIAFIQPLDKRVGLNLLEKDTTATRFAVQNLVHVPLSDEQFGALTSFVFNVGSQHFATSTMRRYINNSEFDSVPKEFSKWIKSGGKIYNGLIARRACEASLFNGNLAYGPDHKFHREDCESIGAAPSAESLIDIDVGEKQ
jgi:lysozyme